MKHRQPAILLLAAILGACSKENPQEEVPTPSSRGIVVHVDDRTGLAADGVSLHDFSAEVDRLIAGLDEATPDRVADSVIRVGATSYRIGYVATVSWQGDESGESPRPGKDQKVQALDIIIESEEEHFGHNISEEGIHTVWVDGVRGRIVGTGEPFVVYWVNRQLAQTGFRFEKGAAYSLTFRRAIQDGVMGYEGKCIDIDQLMKATEKPEQTP